MARITITRDGKDYDVTLGIGHVVTRVTCAGEEVNRKEWELAVTAEEWQQIREVALSISPARAGDTLAG